MQHDKTRRVLIYLDESRGGVPQTPTQGKDGDVGRDLYASRSVIIPPHTSVDVHTDVYMRMNRNTYARITGRSSTLRMHNLLVNEGIIDSGYTGELFICIHNLGDQPYRVVQGMRLAQLIFGDVIAPAFVQCQNKEDGRWKTERGPNGFGHTGM